MKISTCRSCAADIHWLKNEHTGKLAPIDVKPTEAGNITINGLAETYRVLDGESRELVRKAVVADGQTPPLHTNHFVTCAHAKIWHKAVKS